MYPGWYGTNLLLCCGRELVVVGGKTLVLLLMMSELDELEDCWIGTKAKDWRRS